MEEKIKQLEEVVSQLLPLVQAHNDYLNQGIQKDYRKKSFTKAYNSLGDDERNNYDGAMEHIYNKNKEYLSAKGQDINDKDIVDNDFSSNIEQIIDMAIQNGQNPAKIIYDLAIHNGYSPKQAEQVAEAVEEEVLEQEESNPELTAVDIVERSEKPDSNGSGKTSGYSEDDLVTMLNTNPDKYFRLMKGIK